MRGVALERVAADGTENGAEQVAATADRAPHDRFERFIGRHLAGIDDADLWNKQRTTKSADDARKHKRKKFEIRRRIAGEEHAVLAVANGALNQAELRRGQPAAKH